MYESKYREEYSNYENWRYNTLKNWKLIKMTETNKAHYLRFIEYWNKLCKLFFAKMMYWTCQTAFLSFKDHIMTNITVFALGTYFVLRGEITVGYLLVFISYYRQICTYVNQIVNYDFELIELQVSVNKVGTLLNSKNSTQNGVILKPDDYREDIIFKNVSFWYHSVDVMNDVNLVIKQGTHVAITGESGSGKSTPIKLIARVYSPKSGQIFIDNMDIQKINRNNYYKNVGVVSQESVLFNMSIIDNLRLANAHISEDDIEKICRKFPFLNFINDLEDGLHTVIGEGGAKLSGGQRQMLLFIRVMIQNPEVVVLDETTSALDEVTESQVLDFIKEVWSEKTVIFITHRKNVVDSFEERIEVADKQVRFYESIFCHE